MQSANVSCLCCDACAQRILCTLTCLTLFFLVGVALVVPGLMLLSEGGAKEIPFLVRFRFCSDNVSTEARPVTYELCDGNQSVALPPTLIGDGQAYEPILYITSGLESGLLTLCVTIDGFTKCIFDGVALRNFQAVDRVVPGHEPLRVVETSGTHGSPMPDCDVASGGCVYTPFRSLNAYAATRAALDLTQRKSVPSSGFTLGLKSSELVDNSAVLVAPDVLLEWRAIGLSSTSSQGLLLFIFGLLIADLVPATCTVAQRAAKLTNWSDR